MKLALLIVLTLAAYSYSLNNIDDDRILSIIHNYSTQNLKSLALTAEAFDRQQRGREGLLGGLHDYIDSLSPSQIVDIIVNFISQYQELQSKKFFENLANIKQTPEGLDFFEGLKYLSRKQLVNYGISCRNYEQEKRNSFKIGGFDYYYSRLSESALIDYITACVNRDNLELAEGKLAIISKPKLLSLEEVHDYLSIVIRKSLIKIAIAVDEYDREVSKFPRVGGIIDFVETLTNEEIIQEVMNKSLNNPELREINMIKNLVLRYQSYEARHVLNGLSLILPILSKESLIDIAIKFEKYFREKKGLLLVGGLHDYAHTLTEGKIVRIIRDFITDQPELNQPSVLLNNGLINKEDVILSLPADTPSLIKVALAIESFERDYTNIHKRGGLHDYIFTLGHSEIKSIIIQKADEYPILYVKSYLNYLVFTEYNN